ncbi:MAG: DUF1566 domain-containing protein [Deltaproteobacteria bacterium]|nr:DUF1566 domain-containing protein [Nannocystaceae bacterium]
MTESLYVTSMRADSITWSEARSLCDKLEIDGVVGFRLPYRRELQAIDVARYLRPALHWSRTVPDDDRASAYLIDPESGELSLADKEDSAAVVCVRSR